MTKVTKKGSTKVVYSKYRIPPRNYSIIVDRIVSQTLQEGSARLETFSTNRLKSLKLVGPSFSRNIMDSPERLLTKLFKTWFFRSSPIFQNSLNSFLYQFMSVSPSNRIFGYVIKTPAVEKYFNLLRVRIQQLGLPILLEVNTIQQSSQPGVLFYNVRLYWGGTKSMYGVYKVVYFARDLLNVLKTLSRKAIFVPQEEAL